MEFSSQEYWSGLSFASPGDCSEPGIEPVSLMSPALAGRFFTSSTLGKPKDGIVYYFNLETYCTLGYTLTIKVLFWNLIYCLKYILIVFCFF